MQKRSFRFNLMDALLILLLLAAAAVLLYVFVLGDRPGLSSSDKHRITYVIEIAGLNEEYKDQISVGDTVTDSSKKLNIGTIAAIETQDYLYMGQNSREGTLVLNAVDGFVTQFITVEAEGVLQDDGYPKYSIGGYEIFVGEMIYLSFPDLICSGYCISLDVQ